MGTNYYAVKTRPTTARLTHIGKSSMGWLFLFQTQYEPYNDPPIVWNTWNQIKEWLKANTLDKKDYVIIDEYDEIISYHDFVKLVEEKQKDPDCRENPHNFEYCKNVDGYRFCDEYFS